MRSAPGTSSLCRGRCPVDRRYANRDRCHRLGSSGGAPCAVVGFSGMHVVTACKLGQGTSLARWRAIRPRARQYPVRRQRHRRRRPAAAAYPARTAGWRRPHPCHRPACCPARWYWLFNHYDGKRRFSTFVRAARDAGYEPDPRDDLSGGRASQAADPVARGRLSTGGRFCQVDSLVPDALAALAHDEVDAALPVLDAPLRERYAAAYRMVAALHRPPQTGGSDSRAKALGVDPLCGGALSDSPLLLLRVSTRSQLPSIFR